VTADVRVPLLLITAEDDRCALRFVSGGAVSRRIRRYSCADPAWRALRYISAESGSERFGGGADRGFCRGDLEADVVKKGKAAEIGVAAHRAPAV